MEALNNKLLEEEKTSLKSKRTEMAFNAQVELTKSKSEIIELQTTIIRNLKEFNDTSSHPEEKDGTQPNKPYWELTSSGKVWRNQSLKSSI